MYTRDYGSIKSDGDLYNAERACYDGDRFAPPPPPPPPPPEKKPAPLFGNKLASLRDMKLDDLLLIAIGLLLLMDSDDDGMAWLFIAALLFL